MKRQAVRKLLLLLSFAAFPITVIYLAPAPPIMSLRQGVINLSVMVIVAIFLSGLVFRRAYCGWICPGGGCQLVSKSLNDARVERKKVNVVRIGMVAVWAIMVIATAVMSGIGRVDLLFPGGGRFATSTVRYYLPYIPVVVFAFVFVLVFGRRGFCHRGCWIAPIIAASTYVGRRFRIPSLHVAVENASECTACKKCTRSCPMSIDVMSVVNSKVSLPSNCVQCGTCVDTCSVKVFRYRFASEKFRRGAAPEPREGAA